MGGATGCLTIWKVYMQRDLQKLLSISITHMHRLSCVILAQFFHISSARTRNTDPKFVYCCKWTCYKSGGLRSLILFTHTNSKTAFFNSVPKCFKSFSKMNSAVLPATEMTLGLYGSKRKTNQPTKGYIRNQVPVWLRTVDMPGTQSENKVNQQGLGEVINRMGNPERKRYLSL